MENKEKEIVYDFGEKKEEKQELIIVKQLPIIEERLKGLSIEIDEKVKYAKSLVVSDETVKDVKKVRAELSKEFKELENKRKMVKEKVLTPYQAFEEVYKTCVSDKYKQADADLKNKIDEVEKEQKRLKEEEILSYFNEYALSNNVEWLKNYYQMANINITLSASIKSLREQVKTFIDKVIDDLKLIDTQEHKAKILVEYKKTLNVSNAITTVTDRIKKEEEEIQKLEELAKRKEAEATVIERVEKVATIEAPTEEKQEKIYNMTFKVYGTMEQLKEIKNYMEKVGLRYE